MPIVEPGRVMFGQAASAPDGRGLAALRAHHADLALRGHDRLRGAPRHGAEPPGQVPLLIAAGLVVVALLGPLGTGAIESASQRVSQPNASLPAAGVRNTGVPWLLFD